MTPDPTNEEQAAEAAALLRKVRERLGPDFFQGRGDVVVQIKEGRVALRSAELIFFRLQGRLVASREVGGRFESAVIEEDGSFTFAAAAPAGRPEDN